MQMGDSSEQHVWCTFGAQQIDMNPFSALCWDLSAQLAIMHEQETPVCVGNGSELRVWSLFGAQQIDTDSFSELREPCSPARARAGKIQPCLTNAS